jgi:threonine/homoserine/homoserine lactone efflux protein
LITVEFLVTVVLVSVSGVLSPGPLFLASTLRATKLGVRSGFECAVGHTIVEAPLVALLTIGLATTLNFTSLKVIGLLGGAVLLFFAILQFRQASHKIGLNTERLPSLWDKQPSVILGVLFTGLNPFFILWWLTVGLALLSQAILLGSVLGVVAMYLAHIWMDYAWLTGTAKAAHKGNILLGKWFRILLVIFGIAMAYFGITFLISAI